MDPKQPQNKISTPSMEHSNNVRDIVNEHFESLNPEHLNKVSDLLGPEVQNQKIQTLISKLITADGKPNPLMAPTLDNFIKIAEQRLENMEQVILNDPNLNTEENEGIFGTIKNIFGLVKSWFKGEYTPPMDQIIKAVFCIAILIINPLPGVIDDFFLLQTAVGNLSEVLEDYEDWQLTQND